MKMTSDSGAVGAARALLAEQGVLQSEPWRSTVVLHPMGGWAVRTWTHTVRHEPRPVGAPDYVHHVHPDPARLGSWRVQQVHPAVV